MASAAYAGRMSARRFTTLVPITGFDVFRALVVTTLCLVATLVGNERLATSPRDPDPAWLLLTAGACMSVLLLRPAPRVATVWALVGSTAGLVGGYPMTGPALLALALVGITASRADVRLTSTIGVLSGLALAATAVSRAEHDWPLAAIGGFAVGTFPALVGEKFRAERARARQARELAHRVEQLRDQDVQRAVAEERLRIARDVHDITGHHLSGISLLAAGASRETNDPEARQMLLQIHDLTREALGQTKRTLGVLREQSDEAEVAPLPRLADLEGLLQPLRSSGVAAELTVGGVSRQLPEEVELCAYRVVQESLTNVARHARARAVQVVVDYRPHELALEVTDDGRGAPSTSVARTGTGIEGMRERLRLVEGVLAAGPAAAGGWVVRAVLPLEDISCPPVC